MTVIHVTAQPPSFTGRAWLADGQTGAIHAVTLSIDEPRATLVATASGQTHAEWPLTEIRLLPDHAPAPLALQDPDQTAETAPGRKTGLIALHIPADPVARLYVDDAETVTRLVPRIPDRTRRPPTPNKRRIFGWAVAALASVALIIFVLVPVMADQLAEFLPPQGEQALGDATYDQIRNALSDDFLPVSVCENAEGLDALAVMTARMSEHADLPYPLQVTVLDHEMVNAFALPGGRVVLFQGLIEAADDAEEVAAVLAHEIGHVAARDPARGALRSAGSIGILGLLLGDFAGGTVVLFLANQLISAQYSQAAEAAADAYAAQLMRRAEIRPDGLATFFGKLRDMGGESTGIAAHFMAHPALGDRIAAARAATAQSPATPRALLTRDQWLAFERICS